MVVNMVDAGSVDLASNMLSESHQVINVSDLEEGEINDASDLDAVSEVSTDEELLLRQRIKILENYNSALGKKEARRRNSLKGKKNCPNITRHDIKPKVRISPLANLIVIDDVDDHAPYTKFKEFRRNVKSPRRRKRPHHNRSGISHKVPKKKPKKVAPPEVKSSSSDSDCETTLKHKRTLRDAIGISTKDSSSLKKRLLHFLKGSNDELKKENNLFEEKIQLENNVSGFIETHKEDSIVSAGGAKNTAEAKGEIDTAVLIDQQCEVMVESPEVLNTKDNCTSDDEAETLRQLALNSKSIRRNNPAVSLPNNIQSKVDEAKAESTDSDTAELRMIALKSAMLKKASERKKRKKDIMKKNMKRNVKRKRKSTSKLFSEDCIDDMLLSYLSNDNNTDVETIDMDIDMEPCKSPLIETHIPLPLNSAEQAPYPLPTDYQDNPSYQYLFNDFQYYDSNNYIHQPMKLNDSFSIPLPEIIEETVADDVNDVEEDEDLLRALLLNSITKKVSIRKSEEPVKPSQLLKEDTKSTEPIVEVKTSVDCSDSGLIIRLGESDSGSECETTKNLTKMHHKLTNHKDFQRNLDLYLKTARSKFENALPPQVKQVENIAAKKPTPMSVRHLPKENQEEYRQLVKRMSELEKVRMARQLVQQRSSNPENNPVPPVEPESKESEPLATPSSSHALNGMIFDRSIEILPPSGMEIQLDVSRQKITNQMKILEKLESEGKGLREKTESLSAQMKAINSQLLGSRIALNNNQRIMHVAHRNLVRLRKQHHILLNRIKSVPKSNVGSLLVTIKQNIGTSLSTPSVQTTPVSITNGNVSINSALLKTKSIIPNNPQRTEIQTKPPVPKQIVTKKLPLVSRKDVQNENPVKLPSSPVQSSSSKPVIKCTEQNNIVSKNIIANSAECPVSNEKYEISQISPSPVIVNESTNKSIISPLKTKQDTGVIDKDLSNDNLVALCNSIESKDSSEDQCTLPAHKELRHVSSQPENTQILVDEQKNPEIIILDMINCKKTVCDKDVESMECETRDTKEKCAPIISPSEVGIQSDVMAKDPRNEDNTENCTNHLPIVISMEHSVKDKCVDVVEAGCWEYKSPLHILKAKNNWSDNPQAIFCPFEVGGSCKDPECQYFHPRP